MINESVQLESRTLRTSVLERTHVLDKVRTLSLLPDGLHVTTAMVAAYYEVAETVIRAVLFDHREELESNGYHVLTGTELSCFKQRGYIQSQASSLAVFPRRAVLNVGMLLRDSEVARQVRTYLLDAEHEVRTRPVDNSVHSPRWDELDERIDSRITDVLGKTVVPMLNVLIETSGEQRRELISLREDVEQIQMKLVEHDLQLSRLQRGQDVRALTGVIGTIDAMTWKEFELHVAGLLRRDGCTDVEVYGGHGGDRGVDITARTADGRSVAVQCKNFAPFRHVVSGEMQKFLGASKVLHQADVALYVATCAFTREALAIAAQGGVTAVHRGLLEAWSAGVRLQVLR
ncbi:restriction endonuclease [Streptomyces sp. NBC_00162]|uniref:restriction endonuclease n=1 Tax=Streptomyces sp. NBC_00162 TaxID=2903629 RepID=UPI00214C653B|nr:restriction endonuclease [Streptomyces sp. NBC_00162]UUU41080.1 restriction endonuclease [Streptomyces sp. NBC_00162]